MDITISVAGGKSNEAVVYLDINATNIDLVG